MYELNEKIIDYFINYTLISLVITCVFILFSKNIIKTLILFCIFSLLSCLEYLFLSAPDVAMTEAAIGASISSLIIFLSVIVVGKKNYQNNNVSLIFPFILCLVLMQILFQSFLGLPLFGEFDNPSNEHLMPYYVKNTSKEIGIPSIVAAILASYRGFDTLGEAFVILIAGLIVFSICFVRTELEDNKIVKNSEILKVYIAPVFPIIVLYSLYIQTHGEESPGGGFQAGAILTTAYILYGLIYGFGVLIRDEVIIGLKNLSLCGFLIYFLTGVTTILLGGNFLEYEKFNFGKYSQKFGIFVIEIGVGITVFAVLLMIFLILLRMEFKKDAPKL